MPELPDIELYVGSLAERIAGSRLEAVRLRNPFLLRSVEPPVTALCGLRVTELRRLGKRIAIGFDTSGVADGHEAAAYRGDELWLLLHLMIAGRLHWYDAPPPLRSKVDLAAFDFSTGSVKLTEAGSKKRASLHVVAGREALAGHDPGGLEPLGTSFEEFEARLLGDNRTLKRALTDPRTLSGIGNAYSDEILHAARLSPIALTQKLDPEARRRLYAAMQEVLGGWRERLREEFAGRFPDKVTAFRPGMAVHGRYGKPCPDCGSAVARIRYKQNETNYCPRCQTGGRIYADRSLSRLLKDDWPGRLET